MLMDASKAFDVVDHSSMLNHLHQRGINGKLWLMIDDMYTNPSSKVKWKGAISKDLFEHQGIRQGAVSSTFFFNNRSTPLLHRLKSCPGRLRLGSIDVGALMCADDLALISNSRVGMQLLVNETAVDASQERLKFSETKTVMLDLKHGKKQPNYSRQITLYDSSIKEVEEGKHLGIIRSNDGKNTKTVDSRIQLARRTAYALMGAGLHGLHGLSPQVSLKILNTYVLPRLTFGLETLVLSKTDSTKLERIHVKYLKALQGLPDSTATNAVYLLSGTLPLEAQLHIATLTFVAGMCRRESSLERDILLRQVAMKDSNSHSWVVHIQRLLIHYRLPTIPSLLDSPPQKLAWSNRVRAAVTNTWEATIKDEAIQMKTLSYLTLENCIPGSVHPVWQLGNSSGQEVAKATVKARLLVQRYPLHTSRTSGQQYGKPCPLCHSINETTEHFLLQCTALDSVRQPTLHDITAAISPYCEYPISNNTLMRSILDPEPGAINKLAFDPSFQKLTRHLCYRLHRRRCQLLGQNSYRVTRIMKYRLR
jgi:hypothetical protein